MRKRSFMVGVACLFLGVAINLCGYIIVALGQNFYGDILRLEAPSGDGGALFTKISYIHATTLFVVMALGIVANILWEKKPGDVFCWSLLKPLLVSPMVFYTVYGITGQVPDAVSAHLLAFQNGFFWQAVLKDKK